MCDWCYTIQKKDKRVKIMLKKVFVLHNKVIDVFRKKNYILTKEHYPFIFLVLVLLVQCNVGRLEHIVYGNIIIYIYIYI